MEQFQVFGKAGRNSLDFMERFIALNPEKLGDEQYRRKEYDWFTRRFISVGYYALVDINKVVPQKIDIDESIDWYTIKALPAMIMDHNQLVEKALDALRLNLDQKLTA